MLYMLLAQASANLLEAFPKGLIESLPGESQFIM
jgi:hypothetical protein